MIRGDFMKKAQAALEFLTTYGWAFLVILIMIGALAYFGVLNPKGLLPGRCTFGPEVDCLEYDIDSGTGVVRFRFRNNVGATSDFNFTNMTYLGGTNPSVDCLNYINVQPGRTTEVTCMPFAPGVLPTGDKVKFDITGYYKRADGNYWTPVKGEIFGEAK